MKTNIVDATREFEAWAGTHVSLIRDQIAHKHKQMEQHPFLFLRGAFYRWAQIWPEVCPGLAKSIRVLAVGDLHIASFGTWRDGFGRLVWGVDDFDEACPLPYQSDLVRLAASAVLETYEGKLGLGAGDVCDCILGGYSEALSSGGNAFVLEERHKWLRKIAMAHLDSPAGFWKKIDALPAVRKSIPAGADKAIRAMLPEANLQHRVVRREAGIGSLGHPRYLAIAEWRGGQIALEAKAVVPSAAVWAAPGKEPKAAEYEQVLEKAVRSPDPCVQSGSEWLVRRLAPDSSPIEIESLGAHRNQDKLLHAMAWEAGNIHLGTTGAADKILVDLKKRPRNWLRSAVKNMTKATIQDWKDWKKRN